MNDERNQLIHLESLTDAQRKAVDIQIAREGVLAIERTRTRLALGAVAPVGVIGVGAWAYGVAGSCAARGVELDVAGLLLLDMVAAGVGVAVATGFVAFCVWGAAMWAMGAEALR